MSIEQFRDLYKEGLTDLEISLKLKVSRGTVCYWRNKLNLLPHSFEERNKSFKFPNLKDTELAYLAGLIDGEGCICISRSSKTLRANVSIFNTSPYLIKWLESKFPDEIAYKKQSQIMKHKDSYRFSWNRIISIKFLLERIYPFLIIKKPHAGVMLDFCNYRLKQFPGISSYVDEDFKLYIQMQKLNRKGKNV